MEVRISREDPDLPYLHNSLYDFPDSAENVSVNFTEKYTYNWSMLIVLFCS